MKVRKYMIGPMLAGILGLALLVSACGSSSSNSSSAAATTAASGGGQCPAPFAGPAQPRTLQIPAAFPNKPLLTPHLGSVS